MHTDFHRVALAGHLLAGDLGIDADLVAVADLPVDALADSDGEARSLHRVLALEAGDGSFLPAAAGVGDSIRGAVMGRLAGITNRAAVVAGAHMPAAASFRLHRDPARSGASRRMPRAASGRWRLAPRADGAIGAVAGGRPAVGVSSFGSG
ncbi:hypothetical protein Sya03_50370 [Spirilliplanes yamanashiensis]|uniref:Uncharacterized protein n=1 Tax=Spirilliplanes yamanashiensis TaxID=42233 RepID=A0A8J4DM19_9ACTN|nr:hypothetical protein Sya03_50370 [Spirilliplanes yamanashiensis]